MSSVIAYRCEHLLSWSWYRSLQNYIPQHNYRALSTWEFPGIWHVYNIMTWSIFCTLDHRNFHGPHKIASNLQSTLYMRNGGSGNTTESVTVVSVTHCHWFLNTVLRLPKVMYTASRLPSTKLQVLSFEMTSYLVLWRHLRVWTWEQIVPISTWTQHLHT
jgi:hypothetical protein